jgi:heme exporter protein B
MQQIVLRITRKNLLLERRAGEALLVTAPFGAVALWITPVAVGTDTPLLRTLGPGMYWLVILLFGVLVTLRQSAVDLPSQAGLLVLAGVPGPVRLFAGALASALLLLVFELMLAPVALVLYDPLLDGWPWVLAMLPAVAAGLALLGGIAEALLQPLGMRMTLGPLLSVPLALPLLLGATQTSEAASVGRSPLPWFLLVLIVDLVLILAALFVGRVLEESA